MRSISDMPPRATAAAAATVLGLGLAACGSSPSTNPATSSSTPSSTSKASSGSRVDVGSGVKATLPAGWATQGNWNLPDGSNGVSVQNNKPGKDAVVVDFGVNRAASVPPNHPTPGNATDALKAWSNALDDSVDQLSGPLSNAVFGPANTLPVSSPGFGQFAGRAYTGAVNGGKNKIAGFMISGWNSSNHHDVFAWLITSDKSHAVSALPELQSMLKSLGS